MYERVGLTKREYYNDDILKPHERDFVRKFSRLGEEVRWIKRDSVNPKTLGYNPTNDFVWRGKEWELKKPKVKKYKNIVKMIKPSINQEKKNFMIDFGNAILKEGLEIQLSRYNVRNTRRRIKNLYIFDREGLKKILLRK